MGERAGWKLAEGVDPLDGDLTLLGLTVGVDLGYWSEILGFGQGDELAYTRRAPFTELAIRAKPPRSARQDRRAFMAHIPLDVDGTTFGRWGRDKAFASRTAR